MSTSIGFPDKVTTLSGPEYVSERALPTQGAFIGGGMIGGASLTNLRRFPHVWILIVGQINIDLWRRSGSEVEYPLGPAR